MHEAAPVFGDWFAIFKPLNCRSICASGGTFCGTSGGCLGGSSGSGFDSSFRQGDNAAYRVEFRSELCAVVLGEARKTLCING